jgi:folate-dependent phosphoribosylglycinamide formyltransferase PurN
VPALSNPPGGGRAEGALKVAWFATARGQTSGKLLAAALDAINDGRLDARIAVVFCNRDPGEDANTDAFQGQVRAAGIPLVTLSSREFRRRAGGEVVRKGAPLPGWRREYDREVMRLLAPYEFEIGVLAGYMLIFGEEATSRWDLLNLHPAAPGGPAGVWQDVIRQLIVQGAQRAGVMMHLATPELDEGPVVTYCTYPIRGGAIDSLWREAEARGVEAARAESGEELPLFKEIRRRGVLREVPLVIETLRAFADGRVRILDKRPVDASGAPIAGYDLTEDIERAVAEQEPPA